MADEHRDVANLVLQTYRRSPATFDLVISAFLQSLHSHRRSSVCTPFPISLFATEQGEKDFNAAELALKEFTQLYVKSGILQAPISQKSVDCDNLFSRVPLQALKLLQWLLRLRYEVHLVGDPALELPNEIFRKAFRYPPSTGVAHSEITPNFILKLEESDARATGAFEQHRSEFGSVFAFHGTSAENLHSILRCGLLNLSNSSLQRNGAIFGEGIYLSSDPAVALGFSKAGMGWECSHCGQRARYLLLCEVAMGGQVLCSGTSGEPSSKRSHRDLGTYIVVQNCELVKLRFIFVYSEPLRHMAVQYDLMVSQCQSEGLKPKPWRFWAAQVNWCKLMIVFYALLLMGIAILSSHGTSKFFVKVHKTGRR